MATPTPVEGFSPAPACHNSMVSHGHQYSDGHHHAWRGYSLDAEFRRIGDPIAPHNTHSSFPMTKSAMDNHFFATPNSNYPRQASDVELLLPSPPPSGLRPISWGPVSEPGRYPGAPSLSPLPLPAHTQDTSQETCDTDMHLFEDIPIIRQRKPMANRKASLMSILRDLQKLKFTVIDLLLCIIDGEGEFHGFRNALFSPKNRAALFHLFDRIYGDDKERIHTEMEAAKPWLRMNATEVSPAFIEQWDIHKIMEPLARDITPTSASITESAGESKASRAKPKFAKSKNRATASLIIMAQLHYLRSICSAKVPIGLGLHAWASGTSRQMIDVLHRTCLSVSYPSVVSMIYSLAEYSIDRARAVSLRPHALAYDNINISSSIFSEHGPHTISKAQSGTFAVIYEPENARLEDMRLLPMINNLRQSSPLIITDLCPSVESMLSYMTQTAVNIVRILTKYVKGFENQLDASLQHIPRRSLSLGHKTVFHPLKASTIEETSIDGNLLVHNDIYTVELKRSPDELNDIAIPSFDDQLTNARIRGGQHLRKKDISSWERREVFQLAFGTFHLVMNLLRSVLETHRGSIGQTGSLIYFFSILEKTRLSGEHTDYHTLLSAMTQIIHGLILNAWRMECGYTSLDEFASTNPSPGELLQYAHRIIKHHTVTQSRTDPIDSKTPSKDLETGATLLTSAPDTVYNNITLLTRDLLYVLELVDATSSGDFGRIEDILSTIACIFQGSGSNKYATEVLHLLFNLKEVWTPEFANIMRDNMLVNPSGIPGHAMGIDMSIEHLIRSLKGLFAAKGIYSNWDRLGNITAGVNYLQLIERRVTGSLGSGYQGSTPTDVDMSSLVWRIANKSRELRLQEVTADRTANTHCRPVIDVSLAGYRRFDASSLATFNKKIAELKQGIQTEADLEIETDEIVPCQIVDNTDRDSSELSEQPTLHGDD